MADGSHSPAPQARPARWLALAMALASLGAAAWWWRSRDAAEQPTPAARGAATPASRDALAVRVAIVSDEPWAPTLVVPGTLVPNESVELVSELTRKLVKIHVEEGAVVEKNDVLFELDDDDLLARRARLRAQRGLAKRTVARDDELVATGIAAIESLDQSRTNLDDAQAQLVELEVMLSKTRIRAPFAGTLGIRHVSEGAWVGPAVPLASLYDTRRLKLDFRVPERFADAVTPGAPLSITVAGIGAAVVGRVTVVEPQLESQTRSVIVRGVIDEPGELRPGQFATVTLTAAPTTTRFVPSIAVLPSERGHQVFVERDGVAKAIEVELGHRTPDRVEVLTGVAAGDRVIVTNLLRVRENMAVTATPWTSPAPAATAHAAPPSATPGAAAP
ncbi:MAG: efflux RND transporter periplasmic adaptor subunit [Deltaproteobacteria bacterium]|nr:efflux RND transporter periplasmic adaptor subunit [Deltaproteobacteria bacterium]MBK8718832.1 efflux RND transporter periplasmic adaptor subunit [Deltaproteobacteria bacterium]MBP7286550.1 efflux RND transporter periplasmic adaptor subunit [Nannocystaceae bacterium]